MLRATGTGQAYNADNLPATIGQEVNGSRLVDSPEARAGRERWNNERWPEIEAEGESGVAAGVQCPLPIQDPASRFKARATVTCRK